jgi:cell division protein FtsI (penicillin-binding protein 3)
MQPNGGGIVPAALRQKDSAPAQQPSPTPVIPDALEAASTPTSGTVVLDVEQGGIVVPSFTGKSVRSAIELAESSGLDLEVVGSGLAQNQSPAPGSHVAGGARITVRFGR